MAEERGAACCLHCFRNYDEAEPIRMALIYFGIQFKEKLYSNEEWEISRNDQMFEFKQLPLLEYGRKTYVKPVAILRFLCQMNNAYPFGIVLAAEVEGIVELRNQIFAEALPFTVAKNRAGLKAHFRCVMPNRYLPIIENLLSSPHSKKYFVGSSVSMADFVMFELGFTTFLRPEMRDLEESFRELAPRFFDFLERFKFSSPALTQYMNEPKIYEF